MTEKYIYAKGEFLPENSSFITSHDRSFRFGDGIFETLLIYNGRIYNFSAHLQRLKAGIEFFSLNIDIGDLEKNCRTVIEKNKCQNGYLRIIISRGDGNNRSNSFGYFPAEYENSYYVLQIINRDFPEFSSVKLHISDIRLGTCFPCKTNSSALYVLAMIKARKDGFDNALLLDNNGHICETASANIFWIKDAILYTPQLSLPLIPGIIRRKIIELSPYQIIEGIYDIADIIAADEVFMSNIGGLVTAISAIGNYKIGDTDFTANGSAITKQIRELIEKDIRVSC